MNNLMLLSVKGEITNKTFLTKVDFASQEHEQHLQQLITLAHENHDNFILKAPTKNAFDKIKDPYTFATLEEIISNLTKYYEESSEN